MDFILPIFCVLVVGAVIIFVASIRIVQEYERGVIFRLGRVMGAKGPGFFLIVPLVDRMVKVDLHNEKRFMNAKITNATLVPYLYGKYKSDVFVFVNQLDIKASNSGGPADVAAASGFRKIILHYTVYTTMRKKLIQA